MFVGWKRCSGRLRVLLWQVYVQDRGLVTDGGI